VAQILFQAPLVAASDSGPGLQLVDDKLHAFDFCRIRQGVLAQGGDGRHIRVDRRPVQAAETDLQRLFGRNGRLVMGGPADRPVSQLYWDPWASQT
jgi:hypothetical protein